VRLLLTADAVGGVWQYATDLARALAAHGVDVLIALLGPPPSAMQLEAARDLALIETGLPLDWLAETPEEVRAAGEALAALARARRVDLVQLNAPALAAGAAFEAPVVVVTHSCLLTWWKAVIGGPMPEDFAWRVGLHAEGLRAADLVVAPTSAFAEATRRAYRLGASLHVVHNGRAPFAPLVLSDIPTFRELWEGAASFVDPLDDAGFAAAISRIAGDDLARAEWGRKAKERATRYSVLAMAAAMVEIYQRVLGARGTQARAAA
jgi:glycosyltransferase involved in cell wall biosynthesis